MADPLEGILDDPGAAASGAAAGAPEKVELSKEDYEALQKRLGEADALRKDVNELSALIRANAVAPVQDNRGGGEGGDNFDWAHPTNASAEIARAVVNKEVAPMAQKFAASLGSTAVRNFKIDKSNDKFYSAVAPLFDQKVAQLNLTWLGGLDDKFQTATLQEAWNASVGEYVNTESSKRAAARPVNLGGGDSGGTGGGKGKSLQELDRGAYILAMQGGLSDEEMAEIAKEIEG